MDYNRHIIDIKRHFNPLFKLIDTPFYVAGGAITDIISYGYVTNDYDITFESIEDMEKFEEQMLNHGAYFSTDTPFTKVYNFLNCKFDLYQDDFSKPIDMIDKRDILATTCFLDNEYLYLYRGAINDSKNRIIHMSTFNEAYKHRVKHYMDKGFTLGTGQNDMYDEYLKTGKSRFYDLDFQKIKIW